MLVATVLLYLQREEYRIWLHIQDTTNVIKLMEERHLHHPKGGETISLIRAAEQGCHVLNKRAVSLPVKAVMMFISKPHQVTPTGFCFTDRRFTFKRLPQMTVL